ncbi:MAG: 2-dehydropantoate 2-reductase [Leptospiraceae bacterium]|nr:2-dehydropantoate 2-reductase [Leptospiraceae bacterium]
MAKKLEMPTIAVIGAGAVGSYYGAKLVQAGYPVSFYSRQAKAKGVKKLQIRSIDGDFSVKANFYDSTQLMPPSDIVVVSLKALAQIDYVSLLRPVLKDDSDIVLLQNGILGEETLHELFPGKPVHGALAFTCIERIRPGLIEHSDYGLIKMAPLEKKYIARTRRIASYLQEAGIDVKVETNLRQVRWEKLLWNIPYNCLSVVLRADTREIMADPEAVKLVQDIMQEVVRVAVRDGVKLSSKNVEEMLEKTKKMKPYRTSMLLDYLKGREIELEAILGIPVKLAGKLKVAVPKMEMLLQLLRYLDKNRERYLTG